MRREGMYSYDRRVAAQQGLLDFLFVQALKQLGGARYVENWMKDLVGELEVWDERRFWEMAGGTLASRVLGVGYSTVQHQPLLRKLTEHYLEAQLQKLLRYKQGSIEEGSIVISGRTTFDVDFVAWGDEYNAYGDPEDPDYEPDPHNEIERPDDDVMIKTELDKLGRVAGAKHTYVDGTFVVDPQDGEPYRRPKYSVLCSFDASARTLLALEKEHVSRVVQQLGPTIDWAED